MKTFDLSKVDQLGELLQKAIGLADLLQAAGEYNAEVTSQTLTSTAWALRDMLTEARKIALSEA